mgnify:CR=1 FL=1
MKTIILIAALNMASFSFAQEKVHSSQIMGSDMIQQIKDQWFYAGILEGELEDLGSSCKVELQDLKDGRMAFNMTTDAGLTLNVVVDATDKVSRQFYGDEDYSVTYKWDGFKKVEFIHADDAYDTVLISTGTTTLTCGAYY